jgi:hypothetical protein
MVNKSLPNMPKARSSLKKRASKWRSKTGHAVPNLHRRHLRSGSLGPWSRIKVPRCKSNQFTNGLPEQLPLGIVARIVFRSLGAGPTWALAAMSSPES